MQARSLSFDAALRDLSALLLRMALAQTVPDALEDDLPERGRLASLASQLDRESVQLYYQIALQGRHDLPLAPDEHAGFLMTVLRMLAFRPEGGKQELAVPQNAEKKGEKTSASSQAGTGDWAELVERLAVTGAARELARNAELRSRENGTFDLVVPKAKAFLTDRNHQEKLKSALEQHLGGRVTVKVSVGDTAGASVAAIASSEREARQVEAVRSVKGDGFVQDLVNMFDAKVVDATIRNKDQ
jgi:DNA polymerase-3 subunit gamma/tau